MADTVERTLHVFFIYIILFVLFYIILFVLLPLFTDGENEQNLTDTLNNLFWAAQAIR